ncbi:hypothetical protein D3C85_1723980 [compost metagenome]
MGLHQTLVFFQFFGHLLKRDGQCFFSIAVDSHRQLAGQAFGNLIQAVGQAGPGTIDQLLVNIGRQCGFTMRTQT